MKKGLISQAVGEMDTRHVKEAMTYHKASAFRRSIGRTAIAAVLLLSLLAGLGSLLPLGGGVVKAYACGANEEISRTDTVLPAGTITNEGAMRGHQVLFFIVGKDITTIRFSCKNQWIDFIDWTQKRDEYGQAKNFTVPYGKDESEYSYLTIDWVPEDTIRVLTDHKDTIIADLPAELREDVIVLQITYKSGKTATKAMRIGLQDNGQFIASFRDYAITAQDRFIEGPDSRPIPRDTLYAQSGRPGK